MLLYLLLNKSISKNAGHQKCQITGVARNFDWRRPKMEKMVTLFW